MNLFAFYGFITVISLSGVMSPGPLTAFLIARGKQSPWAGIRVTLGHALAEVPLIIALYAGLRLPFRVAGILALSTYLPAAGSLAVQAHPANRDVPIFLAHGSQDPVIALGLSERSRAAMADLGYVVEVHTYPMPHSVCAEEVRDIASWLQRVLAHR